MCSRSYRTFLPLVLLLNELSCTHQSQSAITEIRKESSSVVIGWHHTTGLQIQDPGCQSGYWKGFSAAECSTSKASKYGTSLVLEFEVPDPVRLSRQSFIEYLTPQIDTGNFRKLQREIEDIHTKEISGSLLISLTVTEWKFWIADKPTRILTDTPMQFWFAVRGSLTRIQSNQTLWTDVCFYRSNERDEGPYKFEDLLRNGGAMMKQIIERAAHSCGKDLAEKLLTAT